MRNSGFQAKVCTGISGFEVERALCFRVYCNSGFLAKLKAFQVSGRCKTGFMNRFLSPINEMSCNKASPLSP